MLREHLAAIENGSYVPKQKESVAEFMQPWMETYAATNTTLRTQEGYRGNITRYINPASGGIPAQHLTSRHIQKMYAGLIQRGLSARTVLHVHRVLKQALGHAVKWGMVARNVADAVSPPRPQNKEMEMWDEDTVDRFLAALKGHRFEDFYQLALVTGMRRSELAGLKWENVDLAAGRLSVVSTRQRIIGQGILEGQPKTRKSKRSIKLGPDTVELMHEIRGRQMEQRLVVGDGWEDSGFVLTQSDGRPVNPIKVSQVFASIVRQAGLPHLTLPGLRHAHATDLMASNVNPKVVSEKLGHSNIGITMDTYSHVLPGLQEEAAIVGEQVLGRRHSNKKRQEYRVQNGHEMVTNSSSSDGT